MCFVVTCWERADLLALVCGVFCEFVTFPLVSWVRCGTWLYRFLIFATLLTLTRLEISIILKHSGRHMALSSLVTLFISSLLNLDIEANKCYDWSHRLYGAAILTPCYTQHALRPYIDSEINHIRHFIEIQFVNKRIEFINLPSIFKDKSVISSISTYFENKESPIIVISIINLFVVLFLTITN